MAHAGTAVCNRDTDFFRAMLVGLTIDCPIGKSVGQCVLRADRSLPFEARVAWVKSLTDEAVRDLYGLHRNCFYAET